MRQTNAPGGEGFAPPIPDVGSARAVVGPPGDGDGFWAGAPSAAVDNGKTYLAYRLRRPRGQGRGGPLIVAASEDGERFDTLLEISQEALGDTSSIERPALVRLPGRGWRLYVSYVDPYDNRWRIDLLEAHHPANFDPQRRRKLLTAEEIGGEAIKDPVIVSIGGVWHMWASYLPHADREIEGLHGSADAYTNGKLPSLTGYATSLDGLHWSWHGTAIAGKEGEWDAYCTRITSVMLGGPVPFAYYDGGASVEGNYEEKTGLAFGSGLGSFTGAGTTPLSTSPHASGSLRYVSAVPVPEGYRMYYEAARPDGSHELYTELVACTP